MRETGRKAEGKGGRWKHSQIVPFPRAPIPLKTAAYKLLTTFTYDQYSRVKETHRFWRPQSVIASGDNLSPNWNSFASINTYNALGAVIQVEDGTGHVWWECDEADFDARGNLLEYTQGNGVVTSREYDFATGFLEEIELSNLTNGVSTYGFQHDRLGNLTQRTLARTLQPTLSETFGYDSLNRLVGVDDASSFVQYNSLGNISERVRPPKSSLSEN